MIPRPFQWLRFLSSSAFALPNYLGLPFQILVSPFMPFNPDTKVTNIMMFNSQNLGALVVKEDPHVNAWDDARYGIQEMTIEESESVAGSELL